MLSTKTISLALPLLASAGTGILGMPTSANAQTHAKTAPFVVRGVSPKAVLFPLTQVRLLPIGPFYAAQETDRAYLLRLDPDRLLSHLRRIAGLHPKAAPYGGWDTDGAGTIGHYLSACSQMAASTGDSRLQKRVAYIVDEMAACQKANGDGGLYSFDWDKKVWFVKLKQGEVIPTGVNAWYTTHKTLAGLRDAYQLTGNERAKRVLLDMSDWAAAVTAKLTPDQWQTMLKAEHGGPQEIFADVYALTGDKKYLMLAEKFKQNAVFDPLVKNDGSVLDGLHANTQIPKFIGDERIYEMTGDPERHNAALNFWNTVVQTRSWANGANSQWESFFAPVQFEEKLQETCGPETCNTYNMIKLSEALWKNNPSAPFMDYTENALYNHILPSQSPGGGFTYYTPMRPGHYRVFSRPFDAFWCCVGTGMENHARYGELIYAHGVSGTSANDLYVNLFIPSQLTWKDKGLTLKQETSFPEAAASRLVFSLVRPQKITLRVRRPSWVKPTEFVLRVNGRTVPAVVSAGYAAIARTWKTGDRVEVVLPMHLQAVGLPQSKNYAAFKYGPVLLAGALGKASLTTTDFYGGGPNAAPYPQLAQKIIPQADAPALIGDLQTAASHAAPVQHAPLTFHLTGTTDQNAVILRPFYTVFYERYSLYFPLVTAAQALVRQNERDKAQQEARSLDVRTIDRVFIGNPESESAHHFAGDQSTSGVSNAQIAGTLKTHWRDAQSSFRYTLDTASTASLANLSVGVRCVYWGSDASRVFDVLIDGQAAATERLDGTPRADYRIVTYPVPDASLGKPITVEFRAHSDSKAGSVYDVRTVRLPSGGGGMVDANRSNRVQ